MTYRNSLDIELDILEAIASGKEKKTHVMFTCNLSYGQLQHYLQILVSKGWIEKIKTGYNENIILKLTPRGITAFNRLTKLQGDMQNV